MDYETVSAEAFGASLRGIGLKKALRLGYDAAWLGGTAGAVLNAANEAAVERFRDGRILFGKISALAEEILGRHRCIADPTLAQLLEADAWARQEVDGCL